MNHQWGHTAIGQDGCDLFGNHPTMTQIPYVFGGSLHYFEYGEHI